MEGGGGKEKTLMVKGDDVRMERGEGGEQKRGDSKRRESIEHWYEDGRRRGREVE